MYYLLIAILICLLVMIGICVIAILVGVPHDEVKTLLKEKLLFVAKGTIGMVLLAGVVFLCLLLFHWINLQRF